MRFISSLAVVSLLLLPGCNGTTTETSSNAAPESASTVAETASASNEPTTDGTSRDLNPGVVIGSDLAAADSQRQVLIYYVNEPHAGIYRKLQGWTAETDDAEIRKAGERLADDLAQFPAAVQKDLEAIRASAPAHVGIAIFTNELVREGKCQIKQIGDSEYRTVDFDRPAAEAADKKYHPVSDPAVMAAALAFVAGQFDPGEHNFALVTKAHGAPQLAISTLFGHVMGAESSDQLMEMIAEFRRAIAQHAAEDAKSDTEVALNNENQGATVGLLDKDDVLDGEQGGRLDPMGENTLAGKALLSGMTKDVYFDTLAAANERHGMQFSLVFLEACKSQLDEQQTARLTASQPNEFIGVLYASDMTGLRYNTIDYSQMLEPVGKRKLPLIAAMRQHLDEIQETQEHIAAQGELDPPRAKQ